MSAVGHNGFIINYQSPELIGGTSQSSPTFAAVVALLAEEFKQKTGKSFGFINPLLYKMWADDPSTFIDVTEGDNSSYHTLALPPPLSRSLSELLWLTLLNDCMWCELQSVQSTAALRAVRASSPPRAGMRSVR